MKRLLREHVVDCIDAAQRYVAPCRHDRPGSSVLENHEEPPFAALVRARVEVNENVAILVLDRIHDGPEQIWRSPRIHHVMVYQDSGAPSALGLDGEAPCDVKAGEEHL